MPPPTYSPLTGKETAWLATHLEAVPLFIDAYAPADSGQPVTPAVLDRAYASWFEEKIADVEVVNSTLNILGVQFGQFLVESAGFDWIIVTDDHGAELAIRAMPDRGDVMIFPQNFVAKRWELGETHFLEDACREVAGKVAEVRAMWDAAAKPARPWWKFW